MSTYPSPNFQTETLQAAPTWPAQAPNTVWSGPSSGANAAPTARALVSADLPSATTSAAGAVPLATNTQTLALSDTSHAVTPSNLGALLASTSQLGIVQLADSATAQALTDASKPITPATLKAAGQGANQSLASSGYQKLPGGLIIQWGSGVTTSGSVTITLPITLPNAILSIATSAGSSVQPTAFAGHSIISTSQIKLWATVRADGSGATGAGVDFVLVGY